MSTIINISAAALSLGGSTSLCLGDDENTLGSIGSTATCLASTVSSGGNFLSIKVGNDEVDRTKTYVESLTEEQQQQLRTMLDEKETTFNDNDNYQYKKTK
jgi:hypothetical protein